jgi:hypothetical protein
VRLYSYEPFVQSGRVAFLLSGRRKSPRGPKALTAAAEEEDLGEIHGDRENLLPLQARCQISLAEAQGTVQLLYGQEVIAIRRAYKTKISSDRMLPVTNVSRVQRCKEATA